MLASTGRQQALRAQAVAARTLRGATSAQRTGPKRSTTSATPPSCQVYGGVAAEYPTTDAAVQATAGEILTYDGEPGVHRVLRQQRRLDASAGDDPYLPAERGQVRPRTRRRPAGPSTFTDDRDRAGLARRSATCPASRSTERDGNGEWGGRAGTVTLTGTGAP